MPAVSTTSNQYRCFICEMIIKIKSNSAESVEERKNQLKMIAEYATQMQEHVE